MKRVLMTATAATGVGVGSVSGAALAQDGPLEAASPVMSVYFGGADRLLDDEVDRGLLEAMRLLPARLGEAPGEIAALTRDERAEQMLRPALGLLGDVLLGEFAVSFNLRETDWSGTEPVVNLTVWPREGVEARGFADRFVRFAEDGHGAMFSERGQIGFRSLESDDLSLLVGDVDTPRGEAFVLSANEESPKPIGVASDPIFAIEVNLEHLEIPRDELENEPEARRLLDMLGVTGTPRLRIFGAVERRDGMLFGEARMPNFARIAERWGVSTATTLETREVLRLAPERSTMVQAFAFDFGGVPSTARRIMADFGLSMDDPETPQPVKMTFGAIEPLFASLGDDVLYYRSLETGGGGALSGVLSVGVDDPVGLKTWFNRWIGMGNGAAANFLRGYVTAQRSEMGGVTMWSLRTTGAPTPLDITMALTEDRLVVGFTSTTVRAALAQHEAANSVLDNEVFMSAANGTLDEPLVGLAFTDMAWHAERAYYMAEAVTVTAANMVRQRFGGPRDPGMVTPTWAAFTEDVRPAFGTIRWDGADLVSESWSDGSFLVNFAVNMHETLKTQAVGALPGILSQFE
jgi:hypothetical protein